MANPILQMLGSSMTGGSAGQFPLQMFRQFQGLMRGRSPEQLLREFIRQNNIPQDRVQAAESQAREICRMFGLK